MPTILVVDDEPAVRHVVRTTLETRDYSVRLAEDGSTALDVVQHERPDLIVLDWMLPDMSGLEVCRGLRANPNTAYIPIIFLTALDELDRKIAGLEAGADDYMTKPFEPQELLARVNRRLRTAAERGQLSPLTGLPGNTLIEQAILARLAQPQTPFALLYFDLNEFKAYNDFFGFSWGDELLKALAAVIRQTVAEQGGPNTFLGHVGGDDFVAICRPDRVVPICEQAIRQFEREATRLCAAAGSPNGFVAKDRAGQLRRFGPAALSIGVITTEQRTFDSYLAIGQVAAQVKSAAKRQPGSSYVIDRRRAGGAESLGAER
jgi:diguanylate cyclase (GGDEF)-like protein